MKRFSFVAMLLFGLFLGIQAQEVSLKGMEWKLPPTAKFVQSGKQKLLVVDVPPNTKRVKNYAEGALPLTPETLGSMLTFKLRVRAKDVTKPQKSYNGIKFMVSFTTADGQENFPATALPRGSFDWREVELMFWLPKDTVEANLCLGLQESEGHVEYDLSVLRCKKAFLKDNNYKVKYSQRVKNTPPLRGVMSPNPLAFKPSDLEKLGEWNVNLVRFQICRNWGKTGTDLDMDEYDTWFGKCLNSLDALLPDAKRLGIQFVIDVHWPVGGRIQSGELRIFHEKPYLDHFIDNWKTIAKRYKGNPSIWGYDIINEPSQRSDAPYDYWTIQKLAAEAIRTIDPETPIIIESNETDRPTAFPYLRALEMDNVIYEVHMYFPQAFTHQKGDPVYYPGRIGKVDYNRDTLKNILAPVLDFQKRHNCRIYVGEFSAIAWAPKAENYLKDVISVFEEFGWDWTYHAYREAPCWDLEKEASSTSGKRTYTPSEDNPRLRVMRAAWQKNK
ncbi:MAG: cellulase family glycosylhydrolase [Victivallales bacterium]|nr:cellulase family glycosylhydrolase [Victivallales bacterium]